MRVEGQKTLFIDIDGTLLHHWNEPNAQTKFPLIVLDGVLTKIAEWIMKGYQIILVTGRRESERSATIKQLENAGIVYDMLIMGLGRGDRVVINDLKPGSNTPTAVAITVERNKGISDVEI